MGDDLLELAKAKELASVMGGAWHSEEWDSDSDSEQTIEAPPRPPHRDQANGISKHKKGNEGGGGGGGASFLSRTLSGYHWRGGGGEGNDHGNSKSLHGSSSSSSGGGGRAGIVNGSSSMHGSGRSKSSGGGGGGPAIGGRGHRASGGGRRPANGKAPGRRDPAAVARLEAEEAARIRAEQAQPAAFDRSWQLPVNVDYYTAPAALLRELVKEMPADKRLSFQTRVANARTKEAIESLLEDYATRLESLVLPHARSREIDLQQVKKDMARERVILDGKEITFWENASEKPHTWHEELWATVEARVMEGLVGGKEGVSSANPPNGSAGVAPSSGPGKGKAEAVGGVGVEREQRRPPTAVGSNARALAWEEWNKARAVAMTSEVFKAMSRTGAGGDAYFALVALFCTADKLVVPVHCQESPITVEFLSRSRDGGRRKSNRHSPKAWSRKKDLEGGRESDDVHVVVTVPSTFDIYLRDGAASKEGGGNSGGGSGGLLNGSSHNKRRSDGNGGGRKNQHGRSTRNMHSKGDGAAATDASIALHLVRVKVVVEEEIQVVGSSPSSSKAPSSSAAASSSSRKGSGVGAGGRPADDGSTPTLRFLLDPKRDQRRGSHGSTGIADGRRQSNGLSNPRGSPDRQAPAALGRCSSAGAGGDVEPSPGQPHLALTRTERRMCVAVVPEPSVVSEMVRSFSRRIGVDVPGPQPPRVLGR